MIDCGWYQCRVSDRGPIDVRSLEIVSSYFGLMFRNIAVSFSDLGDHSEIVNCIGLFIDQSPDRDRWCVTCTVWFRTLYHRAWLQDTPEGIFTVTLL